jgi:hypothetical protein
MRVAALVVTLAITVFGPTSEHASSPLSAADVGSLDAGVEVGVTVLAVLAPDGGPGPNGGGRQRRDHCVPQHPEPGQGRTSAAGSWSDDSAVASVPAGGHRPRSARAASGDVVRPVTPPVGLMLATSAVFRI